MTAYEAYWYLQELGYIDHLDIMMSKVNPETNEIDDDNSKNTKVEVWLETGLWDEELMMPTHDIDLDVGAETFEEAIIKLAQKVKK